MKHFRAARLLLGLCLLLPSAAAAADPPRMEADPLPAEARLRLGSTRFRDGGFVSAMALSPDGKVLALANQNLTLRLLDATTGKELRRFRIQESIQAQQLFFSADGRQLITNGYNGIQFWDAGNGQSVRRVQRDPNQSRNGSIALSANGKVMAIGSQYQQNADAVVWDLGNNKALARVSPVQNYTVHVALSPDGKTLATFGQSLNRGIQEENQSRYVQLWDVATGKEKVKFKADAYQVAAVSFSPDGKKLATAGQGAVQLWDAATGKAERSFAGRRRQGQLIAFSADGKRLAAGGLDGAIQLWESATGKRLGTCEGPVGVLSGMRFRPDGTLLAWGSAGQSVHLWDVPSGKPLSPTGGHLGVVNSLFFAPDGKTLYSGGSDGRLLRWDPRSGKELGPLVLKEDEQIRRMYGRSGPFGPGGRAAVSPDGKDGVSGGDVGGGMAVYDLATGLEVFGLTRPGGVGPGGGAVLGPDSSKLVVVGSSFNPRGAVIPVWDVESGQVRELKAEGQMGANAAAFSPDGKLLAVGGHASRPMVGQVAALAFWDLKEGKERAKVERPNAIFQGVTFLDDRLVLASSTQGGVQVIDSLTGKEIRSFDGPANGPALLTLSPDRRLAAGVVFDPAGSAWRVKVWEVVSGRVRHDFAGHDGMIGALAFSPDGRTLASGGHDTTILLWDLAGSAPNASPIPAEELDGLWATLEDPDARKALPAMRRLIARPAEALPLFQKHLKPVGKTDAGPEAVKKLIAELDSPRFAVRERATKELEKIGPPARGPLRAALKASPSAEVKQRVEKILAKLDRLDPGRELIRPLRSVEVLERVGTPEAKLLLRALADGQPGAPLTLQAKAALGRLGG